MSDQQKSNRQHCSLFLASYTKVDTQAPHEQTRQVLISSVGNISLLNNLLDLLWTQDQCIDVKISFCQFFVQLQKDYRQVNMYVFF